MVCPPSCRDNNGVVLGPVRHCSWVVVVFGNVVISVGRLRISNKNTENRDAGGNDGDAGLGVTPDEKINAVICREREKGSAQVVPSSTGLLPDGVPGCDLQKSAESMAVILVVLIMAVIPANRPQLMAKATPTFSCFLICRPQISFQGSRASVMSMVPE